MSGSIRICLDKNQRNVKLDFQCGEEASWVEESAFGPVKARLKELFRDYQLAARDPEKLSVLAAQLFKSGDEFFGRIEKTGGSIKLSFEHGANTLPFESLTYKGEFISQKFRLARSLVFPKNKRRLDNPPWEPPIRVLLVSGELPAAEGSPFRNEIHRLAAFFKSFPPGMVEVEALDKDAETDMGLRLARKISGAHIVHFAGRGISSLHKSRGRWGWEFAIKARGAKRKHKNPYEIRHINVADLVETRDFLLAPNLVFSNSCYGACYKHLPSPNEGMGADFLNAGVGHFLGCPQKLPAGTAHTDFALCFYTHLLKNGKSIGEAVRLARAEVAEKYPDDPTWSLYHLFGNPDSFFLPPSPERAGESVSAHGPGAGKSEGGPAESSGLRQFARDFASKWENSSQVMEIVTFDDDEALCWLRDFCRKKRVRLLEFTPVEGLREVLFTDGEQRIETLTPVDNFGRLLPLIEKKAEGAEKLLAVFVVDRLSVVETRMLSDFSRRFRSFRSRLPCGLDGERGKNVKAVILSRDVLVPPDLSRQLSILHFPAPELADMENLVSGESMLFDGRPDGDFSRELAFCLQGMTREQARVVLSMCRGLTARAGEGSQDARGRMFRLASERKSRSLARFLPLSFTDWRALPDNLFVSSGGGEREKFHAWVKNRVKLISDHPDLPRESMKFPRGMLVCGPPGSGKTEAVRHLARRWMLPVYALDLNALYPSLTGRMDSLPEDGVYLARLIRALKMVEGVAPNVLLLENVDRHFPAFHNGPSDYVPSAVASRLLGFFLTWLQEKTGSVFVALTAMDGKTLDPEVCRSGRIDRVFDFSRTHSEKFAAALFGECFRRKGLFLPEDFRFGPRVLEMGARSSPAELASMVDEAIVDLFCATSKSPPAADVAEWILRRAHAAVLNGKREGRLRKSCGEVFSFEVNSSI